MSEIQGSPFRVILLAASRSAGEDHKKYSGRRDQVAKMLTPEKLMEAQRMTREWEKSHHP